GAGNETSIDQSGEANLADVLQSGSSGSVYVEQISASLGSSAYVEQTGIGSGLSVYQTGSGNLVGTGATRFLQSASNSDADF
ncbi:hypothetical protein RSW78_26460, partial [Escherichia coli]|nr:hypothetical protein [Escherichia coli]